jgi:hypothetical protein
MFCRNQIGVAPTCSLFFSVKLVFQDWSIHFLTRSLVIYRVVLEWRDIKKTDSWSINMITSHFCLTRPVPSFRDFFSRLCLQMPLLGSFYRASSQTLQWPTPMRHPFKWHACFIIVSFALEFSSSEHRSCQKVYLPNVWIKLSHENYFPVWSLPLKTFWLHTGAFLLALTPSFRKPETTTSPTFRTFKGNKSFSQEMHLKILLSSRGLKLSNSKPGCRVSARRFFVQ